MQARYNQIINDCFEWLRCKQDIENPATFIVDYAKAHGFTVKVDAGDNKYVVYPKADNLPIRIWTRRKL